MYAGVEAVIALQYGTATPVCQVYFIFYFGNV